MQRTNIRRSPSTTFVGRITDTVTSDYWNPRNAAGTGIGYRAERFVEAVRYLEPGEQYRALVTFLYSEGVEMDVAASIAGDILDGEA